MEGSIYERSEIAKESSVGSCNDCSDLSHSIQDLQLGKEKRTSSSNQIQKEEVVSGDTQFKKGLEISPAAIEIMKDEQAIPPEDLWAYHTNINAGYSLPSNMDSDQESFTGSTNSINQYSSYRELNNFLGKKASTSSVYGGPSISSLVNEYIEIQSVLRNPTNVYPSMGDYYPRMDQIASTNHYEFESTGSSRNYSGNSYSFPNTIGSSISLWNQQGVNLGHWNTEIFPERSNLVWRATEEDRSKGLERLSQYQNPEIASMLIFDSGSHQTCQGVGMGQACDNESVDAQYISHKEDMLLKLAHDKFGNYVIQTSLEISKEDPSLSDLNEFLVSTLQPYLPQLAKASAGMNVVRKVQVSSESLFDP
ncbi:hypothetical protein Acr_07g0008650 [Actinidia rufa]|uniref:Uncharacterized protein n=1 Tax=Actinidia rufa TaxID=165716 RepID=A0A7J0EW96_9ERIC|nr:hypothetical protein Acr_07g0008650 [Actinidia rufa]